MDKSSRNERRKVTTQYLNGIAVAVLVAGVISPPLTDSRGGTMMLIAILASVLLHLAARHVARHIED